MKKKIAGVLTTVLAASLLVGGNHPVTVQVDNMISGTQDDEDTQSDEAEAEAEAEEEQSEEAKVAADPEDQPAATETPKEEKKAEKETQKREAAENSSDSTSSDEKTLLRKAKKLAQQYDYTGAISVLKNNWKFATSDKMQEAAAAYMKKRDACVEYPLENITHVFFHSLKCFSCICTIKRNNVFNHSRTNCIFYFFIFFSISMSNIIVNKYCVILHFFFITVSHIFFY